MAVAIKNVKKVKMPTRYLACVRHVGPYKNNPELFGNLFKKVQNWANPQGLMQKQDVEAISIYYDDPDRVPEDQQRIAVGFTVPEGTQPEGEIEIIEMPKGNYVLGSFEIDPEEYQEAWDTVFDFIREENLIYEQEPMYESYKNDPSEHPEGKHLVDIGVILRD